MNVSRENHYRYFVSDCGLQQNMKTFFKRPAVFVFVTVHSRLFYVAVTMALLSVAVPASSSGDVETSMEVTTNER